MKVYNNTPTDVGYNVNWEGGGDCGSLGMGETFEDTTWDDKENVQVTFNSMQTEPSGAAPFLINIDQTGEGMAVTIGIYSE
jgi:hypothetical protein